MTNLNSKNIRMKKLELFKNSAEFRRIQDAIDKAVYILRNFNGSFKPTKKECIKVVENERIFDDSSLRDRLWSIILGHTSHNVHEPRYLAPIHEKKIG